jgi:hypothetical protein
MLTRNQLNIFLNVIDTFLEIQANTEKALNMLFDDSNAFDTKSSIYIYDKYIDLLQYALNPDSEDIVYFIFDCQRGKSEGKIFINSEEFIINSRESFLDYLEKKGDICNV